MAYVRTVETRSGGDRGAGGVVVAAGFSKHRARRVGPRQVGVGGALKAAARQRLVRGEGEFDLGLDPTGIGRTPLRIVGSRAARLRDALCRAYEVLALDRAADGDEVFRDLLLARILEPTSKQTVAGAR